MESYQKLFYTWETDMSQTVEERVIAVVAEQLGVKKEDVQLGHNMVDDLGADSLDVVELVMAIEAEFEIEIPDELAEKIVTIQQIIDKVKEEKPELVGIPKKSIGKALAIAGLFSF